MPITCFGLFRRKAEVEPLSLSQVKALNVRLEKLEGMRSDLGPQLSAAQVQRFVEEARAAALSMQARHQSLSSSERKQFDRLRINISAVVAREEQVAAESDHRAMNPMGPPLTEEEARAFEERLFALRTNPLVCPDERRREGIAASDRREMEYVCRKYPDYVRELLQDQKALEKFFKWAMRSGANVDVFVQFPKTADKLMRCHADKRFGAVFGHNPRDPGLGVEGGQVKMKVRGGIAGTGCSGLSTYVSVHDPKLRIALTNLVDETAPPYIVTVGEIFSQLRKKNRGYENVEVLLDGLSNWNTIQCSSYSTELKRSIRMEPKDWMWQAPPVAIVTRKQIAERYPGERVTEGGIKFSISIAKQFPDTDMGPRVDNNHSFMILFIPEGDGTYRELCIGLQADFLPKGFLHKLWLIGSTELAKVHLIDEARYLVGDMKEGGFRAHKGTLYNLTPEEAGILRDFLAKEIQSGHDGKKIFSPQGNNCANFVQKLFWKLFVDRLLMNPLREAIDGHANRNMTAYLRAIERATKASNDGALEFNLKRLVQNLDRAQLLTVIRGSHELLAKTLYKDHPGDLPPIDLERLAHADLAALREETYALFEQTLKSTQFFRLRIRETDASIGVLNKLTRFFNWLIRHGVSESVISVFYQIINFVFFGSWRFTIFSTEKGVRYKSLFTSKYHQAGTLPLPTGFETWQKRAPRMRFALKDRLLRLEKVATLRRSASGTSLLPRRFLGGS